MFWLICCSIFSVRIVLAHMKEIPGKKAGSFFGGILYTLPLIALSVAFWVFFSCFCDTHITDSGKTYILYDEKPVYTMKDRSDESFSLGCGYADGEMYYVYMTAGDSETIKADSFEIGVTDKEPYIEKYICRFSNPLVDLLASPGDLHCILYLPEGTVLSDFKIDEKAIPYRTPIF